MISRAVLDTSVLLSSYRHELVFLAYRRLYTMIYSSFIIGELVRVRTEIAIQHGQDRDVYRSRINQMLTELSPIATFVDYTRLEGGSYRKWLKDPDDEPILATALVGKANCVVSLNTKDFPPTGSFAHVRYVTPSIFLAELYSQHPEKAVRGEFEQAKYRLP